MSYRNYCSCLNCKDKISTNNIKKHYDRCLVEGAKFIGRKYQVPVTLHCQYCDSLRKNENSLRQHEVRCKFNINAISNIRVFFYNKIITINQILFKIKMA